MSNIEIFANLFTVICIVLAGRNNVNTWWTGIVGTTAFGVLFYQNQLYADVTLQAFFVLTGILGWMAWSSKKEPLPIVFESTRNMLYFAVIAVCIASLYGFMLHFYTDAYAPFIDSLVLTFSVFGQVTLMYRKVQSWYIWTFVNILSVPLYFSRELYLTAGLYSFFLIHAIYVSYTWTKKARYASS